MAFDPDRAYTEVISAGEDWADKKSAYEALDDVTKSILAQLTGEALQSGGSHAQAQTGALASDGYRTHLKALGEARRAFLHAQVRYEGLKMLAELRRTQESTRRAEMKLV